METSPAPSLPLHNHHGIPSWPRALRILVAAAIVTAGAAVGCRTLAGRLTVNVTTSMPRGLYWLRPSAPLTRDATVCLDVPQPVRSLVASRRYLPASFRLLKRVAALPGDRVCTDGNRYVVGDTLISAIATHDHLGRPLAPYRFCDVVPAGAAFLAGRGDSSLDSRYFGPVALSDLTPAVPIWTFF